MLSTSQGYIIQFPPTKNREFTFTNREFLFVPGKRESDNLIPGSLKRLAQYTALLKCKLSFSKFTVLICICVLQKLTKKYKEDTEKYNILQDIVQSEIDAGTTKAKNSATDALLWLKRWIIL